MGESIAAKSSKKRIVRAHGSQFQMGEEREVKRNVGEYHTMLLEERAIESAILDGEVEVSIIVEQYTNARIQRYNQQFETVKSR